jgi:hypothetical protein
MKKTLVVILLSILGAHAGNLPVHFSSNVVKYLDKLPGNPNLAHRSGLLDGNSIRTDAALCKTSSILSYYDGVSANDPIAPARQESFEYDMEYSKPGPDFIRLFNSFSALANLPRHYFDTLNNQLVFIPQTDNVLDISSHYKPNGAIGIETLESVVMGKAASFLEPFGGRLEFCRTDVTRQNGTEILGADVNFRRIFRNGIVNESNSMISVSINGAGEITGMRVRWPRFVQMKGFQETFPYHFYRSQALDAVSNTDNNEEGVTTNGPQPALVDAEISGIAKGWIAINSDEKMILSPCLSFQCELTKSDKTIVTRFLNVPMLKKYYH